MTKTELTKAFALAKAGKSENPNSGIFNGFGLPDFKKVTVTLGAVAWLIGWQAGRFDGTWDLEALTEIEYHGRKKFLIVG